MSNTGREYDNSATGGPGFTEQKKSQRELERFLAVIGPPAVGKTAITNRLINQKFIESYHPTIQDEFKQAFIIENHAISISLLDTTGSEQYFSINAQHISSRDACIFVVSVDKEELMVDI